MLHSVVPDEKEHGDGEQGEQGALHFSHPISQM